MRGKLCKRVCGCSSCFGCICGIYFLRVHGILPPPLHVLPGRPPTVTVDVQYSTPSATVNGACPAVNRRPHVYQTCTKNMQQQCGATVRNKFLSELLKCNLNTTVDANVFACTERESLYHTSRHLPDKRGHVQPLVRDLVMAFPCNHEALCYLALLGCIPAQNQERC